MKCINCGKTLSHQEEHDIREASFIVCQHIEELCDDCYNEKENRINEIPIDIIDSDSGL